MQKKPSNQTLISIFIFTFALSGCILPARKAHEMPALSTRYVEWQKTLTPYQEYTGEQSAGLNPTPYPGNNKLSPEITSVYLHPALPKQFIESLDLTPYINTADSENADVHILLDSTKHDDTRSPSSDWVYALVAPFYTNKDHISSDALAALWRGSPHDEFPFTHIMLPAESHALMRELFGPSDDSTVNTMELNELTDLSLTNQPFLSVLPFEALKPHWKVVSIDDQSPIQASFSPETYALSIQVWVEGDFENVVLPNNYDPQLRTVLIMTGVTALTRATAHRMEIHGNQYPGRDIHDWLTAADLVHISNEVAFAENCPYPNPVQTDLLFCSSPDRIDLLEYVDADIIELSGNHLMDYGISAMNLTLEMYAERGWMTYAGGWDLIDARSPALVTHNGNPLAFIGCNPAGPPSAWATGSSPGSAPCGDYQWMLDEIHALKAEGYLPIVTLQYIEDYTAYPSAKMESDFQRLAEAGAVIVNGSQAHTPKSMVFYEGSFLHYGLGNLFFDQMAVYYSGILMPGTREAFIDRLVFYNGQLISIELLTTMLEDYARPRPMQPGERNALLSRIFQIALDSYE